MYLKINDNLFGNMILMRLLIW